MKIDKSKIEVSFTFSPSTHFLIHDVDDRFPNAKDGKGNKMTAWTLNPRIDMSHKGKGDQIGMPPELYLLDKQAEELKKVGFTWIDEV